MKQERTYSLSSRLLFRGKLILDYISNSWTDYVRYKMSRDYANRTRKMVISEKGREVVDRHLMKRIKEYSREAFGSASYWPWLALYTELRGEFKEGWMPDDYYRFELLPRMNPDKYMRFSDAKSIDHKLFNEMIVEPLIIRAGGNFYDKDGNFKAKPEVKEMLSELNTEVIIKPVDGRSGKRIIFKNSRELDLNDLPSAPDYLFQKVVSQHSELNKLYPHSINTFRVSTFIDSQGSIKIKFVITRFGKGGSRVDNASSGGGWIFVQLNSKVQPYAYDINGINIGEKHPDTDIKYSDLSFSYLSEVIALCKQAHRKFPYTRIIGWDVYVGEDGKPKLIEWNANNPLFWPIEARFGPFFKEMLNY